MVLALQGFATELLGCTQHVLFTCPCPFRSLVRSPSACASVPLCLYPQQDIARGRGMVDELFQGWGGTAGTQNAIMSSNDYISTAQRTLGNIEDGFYISPSFLDKLSIHIAKNFMNLPKIKVPLILGIWGGKGQVRHTGVARDTEGHLRLGGC